MDYALRLINQDRQQNGLSPVALGNNTAAQAHAENLLANDVSGHWGTDGTKPYMRYTQAGGHNYVAENAFRSCTGWVGERDPAYAIDPWNELEQAERGLMNSPGHRRNILTEWHKKVSVGIAYDKDDLVLIQHFEGDYLEFTQVPAFDGPVLSFGGTMRPNLEVWQVQVWYDPLPQPLTRAQMFATSTYSLGIPATFIRPPPPPGAFYPESDTSYSYETAPVDPYTVSPASPEPRPCELGAQTRSGSSPSLRSTKVKWIDASTWNVAGSDFEVQADLTETLQSFGQGVYTIVVWAWAEEESLALTNYSLFVR